MYVLIVSRGYPTSKNPLRGIFEFDQAKALLKAGHKVIFLSVDLRSIRRKRKLGKTHLHKDGVEIFNISVPVGRVPAWVFLFIGRWAVRLIYNDIIKQHGQPEIIHAHFTDIAAMASKMAVVHKRPLIITEHSSLINKDVIDSRSLYFVKNSYGCATRLIAVSSQLATRIKQHFGINCLIIPNIVDVSTFNYQPVEHEGFRFVSVGSLIYNKGFDLLIKTFIKLNLLDCKLIIVGEGLEYSRLTKMIHDLGLKKNVELTGRKTRREINSLMNQSDAFVLASRSETFGVVYIEAMAAGLPVVATKCGGPEDFVNEKTGKLVEVDHPEQLAIAMLDMYNSIDKYDKKKIAEQCKERFSPDLFANKIFRVYNEVVS